MLKPGDVLAVDKDNTINCYDEAFFDYLNTQRKKQIGIEEVQFIEGKYDRAALGMNDTTLRRWIRKFHNSEIHRTMPVAPDVHEIFETLIAHDIRIIIVTARSKRDAEVVDKWLAHNDLFPFIDDVHYSHRTPKGEFCKTFDVAALIDDNVHQLKNFIEVTGKPGLLMAARMNTHVHNVGIRVANWKHAKELLLPNS